VVPPVPFLKSDAKDKDSWKAEFEIKVKIDGKLEVSKAETTFTVSEEEITVPAGKFQTLVVKSKTKADNVETTGSVWYAKGVGPVKLQFDFGGENKNTLELKSVDIKK
jgi:hypothetical protein